MKDWKALARALGLGIPDEDLERNISALDGLESSFRPVAAQIPFETEPATVLLVPPEAQ